MKRRYAVERTSRNADSISLYLVITIACLATALLFMALPVSDAKLTADQTSQISLWGP